MDFKCGQGPQQEQQQQRPHEQPETCADVQASIHQNMFITTGSPGWRLQPLHSRSLLFVIFKIFWMNWLLSN